MNQKKELDQAIKRLVLKNKKPEEIMSILETIYDKEIIPTIEVIWNKKKLISFLKKLILEFEDKVTQNKEKIEKSKFVFFHLQQKKNFESNTFYDEIH